MSKEFYYQRFGFKYLVGFAIGVALMGICLLLALIPGVNSTGFYMGGIMVLAAFPTLIWPYISSDMKCFVGKGTYSVEKNHLVLHMGKRVVEYTDIDELYFSGPKEGGGQMLGAVTSYDGSLDIKKGRKTRKFITSNMWHENEDIETTMQEMYDDIASNFPDLKPARMFNGTIIRGYLRKEELN